MPDDTADDADQRFSLLELDLKRTKASINWERRHDCTETYLAIVGLTGERLEHAIALAFAARSSTADASVLADLAAGFRVTGANR